MSIRKEDVNSKPLENGTPNSSTLLGKSNVTVSPMRLPSFKPPRDLTLGLPKANLSLSAKPRKKFTPNIPTRRDKSNDVNDSKAGDDNSRQGNRSRRGKWENRGRGGGPSRNNKPVFIQTAGSVFGEGIGEATKRYHHNNEYSSHSREGSGSSVMKSTLNLERQQKVDKKEEDLKLESLLSCDFVDDPHSAPDETFRPISLPLLHERKILKKEDREDKVKMEGIKTEDDDNKGIVKIKTEAGWKSSAESNCLDTKVNVKEEPESGDELEVIVKPKAVKVESSLPQKGPNESSVMELLVSSKKGYLMLQLPTCLPGPAPEVVAEVSGKPGKGSSNSGSSAEAQNSVGTLEEVSEQLEECSLNNLPEGHLGTLRVHESGKAIIVLNGGYSLVVNPGTQVGFLQELVSVDLDESRSSGRMLVLGQVCSTLNCTPDLETMILSDGWNS